MRFKNIEEFDGFILNIEGYACMYDFEDVEDIKKFKEIFVSEAVTNGFSEEEAKSYYEKYYEKH